MPPKHDPDFYPEGAGYTSQRGEQNTSYARGWVFTWNNPPTKWRVTLQWMFESKLAVYVCGAPEIGGVTNTPHIQGFIVFVNRVRLTQIRNYFGCTVWAQAMYPNSSPLEAVLYCKGGGKTEKPENPEFVEYGQRPEERDKKKEASDMWENMLALAASGNKDQLPASQQIRFYNTLQKIEQTGTSNAVVGDLEFPTGVWIYGPPGTGKSTTTRKAFEGAYRKNLTKWWDNYRGEGIVIIDDIAEFGFLLPYLKIWGDQGYFQGEVKGNTIKMRPEVIAITSNVSIDEAFKTASETQRNAIKKRYIDVPFDRYRKYSELDLKVISVGRILPENLNLYSEETKKKIADKEITASDLQDNPAKYQTQAQVVHVEETTDGPCLLYTEDADSSQQWFQINEENPTQRPLCPVWLWEIENLYNEDEDTGAFDPDDNDDQVVIRRGGTTTTTTATGNDLYSEDDDEEDDDIDDMDITNPNRHHALKRARDDFNPAVELKNRRNARRRFIAASKKRAKQFVLAMNTSTPSSAYNFWDKFASMLKATRPDTVANDDALENLTSHDSEEDAKLLQLIFDGIFEKEFGPRTRGRKSQRTGDNDRTDDNDVEDTHQTQLVTTVSGIPQEELVVREEARRLVDAMRKKHVLSEFWDFLEKATAERQKGKKPQTTTTSSALVTAPPSTTFWNMIDEGSSAAASSRPARQLQLPPPPPPPPKRTPKPKGKTPKVSKKDLNWDMW